MITIHKQQMEMKTPQTFTAHRDIRPLSVQHQPPFAGMCFWYETPAGLELDEPDMARKHTMHIVGTGHYKPEGILEYISTVQDGEFVWHFYMERAVS